MPEKSQYNGRIKRLNDKLKEPSAGKKGVSKDVNCMLYVKDV